MNASRDDATEPAIARRAAEWIVRRDRGLDARERVELDRWLAADPRHARIFAEREGAWTRFDALGRAGERPRRAARRVPWASLGLAAGLAVALGLAWRQAAGDRAAERSASAVERTLAPLAAAERRFLADGSVVDLGPDAAIEVVLDGAERRIRLRRGAAHFAVARDPARPFVVETAPGVEVRALGTAFDVWLAGGGVDVRVTEGRVEVRASGAAASGPALPPLRGGQRVVIEANASRPPAVEAWPVPPVRRDDHPARYEFERTPLAQAVAELNRRGDVRLEIVDAELAALPIYASFRADKSAAFVDLLEATGELVAVREAGVIRLRRAR